MKKVHLALPNYYILGSLGTNIYFLKVPSATRNYNPGSKIIRQDSYFLLRVIFISVKCATNVASILIRFYERF